MKQAIFVMENLVNGQSKEQIVKGLEGDEQLVTMWISFLKYNKWMEEISGIWFPTSKGIGWKKRLSVQA